MAENKERFHTLEDLENERFGETTKFDRAGWNDTYQDECGHEVREEEFHYSIFKKNDYIALGYYSYNHDHFRAERFMSETLYPFDKDGYLEPISVRKSRNYFVFWSDEEEVDNSSRVTNKKVGPKLQAKWKQNGVDFDPKKRRIISWN
jgi:hypothetical protein